MSWPGRIARFVRSLFSSGSSSDALDDDPEEGGLGVREPLRPLRPTLSGGVALEAPPEEKTDVEALGEERD